MKILLVFAHPNPASFSGALRDIVLSCAEKTSCELRQHDLYDTGFSAALSANEWALHRSPPDTKQHLAEYFADLQWCDTLVFVYPTWWSGQPAIAKAWLDRVLAKDVAWTFPDGASRIYGNLKNVKRIVAITTHGSSKWVNAIEGEAGKRTLSRGLRVLCSWRCRFTWLAMYAVDNSTRYERNKFTQQVERRLMRMFHH